MQNLKIWNYLSLPWVGFTLAFFIVFFFLAFSSEIDNSFLSNNYLADLQDKIIELMDLFDGEVTTADKIDRPQQALDREAYKDFMDRNPMAGGGMLVQPSADGSRPGYNGRKNRKVSYDTENKIVRELNM